MRRRSDHDLDALIDQFLCDKCCLCRIGARILGQQFDWILAGNAALGVDFLNRHFQSLQRWLVIGRKTASLCCGKTNQQFLGLDRKNGNTCQQAGKK